LIDAAIAAALARVPELAGVPADSWRIETLPSLSNRVYRLSGAAGDYVLRFANEAPYLDRMREAHNHRLAAANGLAPPVFFDDPESGTLVTAFEPGTATFDRSGGGGRAIEAVAYGLRRLHGSKLAFKGEMRLAPTMEEYLAIAGRAGSGAAALWSRWRPMLVPVLPLIESELVPSHVDPVPRNILVAGTGDAARVRFVDWEYSAPAAPIWDLADFAIEAELGDDDEKRLLSAYGIEPRTAVDAAFRLYKPLLDLLAAAWAASQIALHGSRAEHDAMIGARLARARAACERPGFETLIPAAARLDY